MTIVGCIAIMLTVGTAAQPNRGPRHRRMAFVTDTMMAHDPVMAYESQQAADGRPATEGTYFLLSTGIGIQWATSKDRKTWVVQPTPFIDTIPQWTHDSVPGFRNHVWAPDIIRWHNRWWLAYSCSTFGKNTSAIGLMTAASLSSTWKDEGCIVASREGRDNWNAIDPCFVIDDNDQPWLAWGSFWDGIQLARLDTTMRLASKPVTIARRYKPGDPTAAENPTSKYAGRNAIEAPFILKHDGYYYLFVSWDYCCRGAKSNYRVAVGRSRTVEGPYLDRDGRDMRDGGGTLVLEGDKVEYEAAGHCAAYDPMQWEDGQGNSGTSLFICHGYSTRQNGAALLIQKSIKWTDDQWCVIE